MRSNRTALIILLAILFLFFLQALSDFIQSIYAFGLLVTAFTPQIAAVVLLFSPAALLFARRMPSRRWLAGLGAVAVLGRLVEPMMDPGGRLVACGVSVGAFLLMWPMILAAVQGGQSRKAPGRDAAQGLMLAVMLSVFFRAAGSSLDISEAGLTQVIAWALAGLAAWLAWRQTPVAAESGPPRPPSTPSVRRPETPLSEPSTHEERREASLRRLGNRERAVGTPLPAATAEMPPASMGRVIGLCLGMASVVVMLYFAFVSPAVISRWTGYPYPGITGVLVLTWAAFALAQNFWEPLRRVSRTAVLAWNVLFVTMLVLTILPHQVSFPAAAEAYPLDARAVSPLWQIPLYAMLVLSPVVFVDFMLFVHELATDRASIRQLGGGFALAALLLLVMVFLQVFTTIYDYARPIGPAFRDRFWLVYLIAGLGMALPVLLANRDFAWEDVAPSRPLRWAPLVLAVLIGAALIATAPRISQPSAGGIRVMTYNIQQGFDKMGNAALPSQLAAMRRVQPDLLGLQESDTARVANGNVDAVRYFADHLGMYSYYGPPTTVGTFGIALLSKYPIERVRTFYMYSSGEQTACIQAIVLVNGAPYEVVVTHLGNGGPNVQLVSVLSRVFGTPHLILMGDFNFDPSTPQYALATQTLADAWLLRWPSGRQLTGGAEGRIDQIFVSPDIQVTEAEYVPSPASDHPYLYAIVK